MLIDIPAVAERLLDAVSTIAGREGVDLPSRRYITPGISGQEAWDCDQVVVGLVTLAPNLAAAGATEPVGLAGGGHGAIAGLPAIQLRVEIVRAVPTVSDDGTPPAAALEHAAGLRALQDAALLHAVRAHLVDGAVLTDGEPVDLRSGPIVPTGPDGGYAGVAMSVAVTVVK